MPQRGRRKNKKIENRTYATEQRAKETFEELGILTCSLEKNLGVIAESFCRCSDLVIREFTIGYQQQRKAAIIYIDGMVDKNLIHDNILKPLEISSRFSQPQQQEIIPDYFQWVLHSCLSTTSVKTDSSYDGLYTAILYGEVGLLLDGFDQGVLLDAKGWCGRGVDAPQNEVAIRGPREGFVETLRINTSMIRRRIKSNQLKIESMVLGKLTQTSIAILYIEDIINKDILKELYARLAQIHDVDSILEGGCIEQYIEDHPYSPFPQIQYTERPDRVVPALLEGRVALIVDGSPDVLILPTVFVQFLQSPEDYYNRLLAGNAARLVRYLGIMCAAVLPSLYVAITGFHLEMLPANIALSIAAARESIPFPSFVEALIMEVAFELLREASIRMPGAIGSTLGVVGALIIGQAAVSANLVAPQMVIVVAITALGSFAVPSFEMSYPLRMIRFPLMILAACLGLYGVVLGLAFVTIHLISLRSFGYPYLEPLAPLKIEKLKDTIIRPPRWKMMAKPLFQKKVEKLSDPIDEPGDEKDKTKG